MLGATNNFYKRLRPEYRFDAYSNFAETWTNASNVLNADFQLFSTYVSVRGSGRSGIARMRRQVAMMPGGPGISRAKLIVQGRQIQVAQCRLPAVQHVILS